MLNRHYIIIFIWRRRPSDQYNDNFFFYVINYGNLIGLHHRTPKKPFSYSKAIVEILMVF
jgi:hypothetical protein